MTYCGVIFDPVDTLILRLASLADMPLEALLTAAQISTKSVMAP